MKSGERDGGPYGCPAGLSSGLRADRRTGRGERRRRNTNHRARSWQCHTWAPPWLSSAASNAGAVPESEKNGQAAAAAGQGTVHCTATMIHRVAMTAVALPHCCAPAVQTKRGGPRFSREGTQGPGAGALRPAGGAAAGAPSCPPPSIHRRSRTNRAKDVPAPGSASSSSFYTCTAASLLPAGRRTTTMTAAWMPIHPQITQGST